MNNNNTTPTNSRDSQRVKSKETRERERKREEKQRGQKRGAGEKADLLDAGQEVFQLGEQARVHLVRGQLLC